MTNLKSFMIYNSDGGELGTYRAANAAEALDCLARDAGYKDHAAACDIVGDDPALVARELPAPKKCQCGQFFGEFCQSEEPATESFRFVPAEHLDTARVLGSSHGLSISLPVTEPCLMNLREALSDGVTWADDTLNEEEV